jgi:hypothetical protein
MTGLLIKLIMVAFSLNVLASGFIGQSDPDLIFHSLNRAIFTIFPLAVLEYILTLL